MDDDEHPHPGPPTRAARRALAAGCRDACRPVRAVAGRLPGGGPRPWCLGASAASPPSGPGYGDGNLEVMGLRAVRGKPFGNRRQPPWAPSSTRRHEMPDVSYCRPPPRAPPRPACEGRQCIWNLREIHRREAGRLLAPRSAAGQLCGQLGEQPRRSPCERVTTSKAAPPAAGKDRLRRVHPTAPAVSRLARAPAPPLPYPRRAGSEFSRLFRRTPRLAVCTAFASIQLIVAGAIVRACCRNVGSSPNMAGAAGVSESLHHRRLGCRLAGAKGLTPGLSHGSLRSTSRTCWRGHR